MGGHPADRVGVFNFHLDKQQNDRYENDAKTGPFRVGVKPKIEQRNLSRFILMMFVWIATEILSCSMLSIVVYPVHEFYYVQVQQIMLGKIK